MATTSPDTLWSMDPTGNYNLVADAALMQTSNQAALVKRANMYVGTSAQRTAFTTAPEGVHWQDTNGDKREYVRQAGAWVGLQPDSGWVSLTNSLLTNFRGDMWAREVGTLVEIRFSLASVDIAQGNTTIGTVPVTWRPAAGTTNPRGTAYFAGGWEGSVYVTPAGEIGLTQRSGASRSGAQGSILFFK